jgi:hypothetical protein
VGPSLSRGTLGTNARGFSHRERSFLATTAVLVSGRCFVHLMYQRAVHVRRIDLRRWSHNRERGSVVSGLDTGYLVCGVGISALLDSTKLAPITYRFVSTMEPSQSK